MPYPLPDITTHNIKNILASHQCQGSLNDCGPFSAAILINSTFDLNLDGRTLGKEMNRPRFKNGLLVFRRIPNWATFPWGIKDIFDRYGLHSSWKLFHSLYNLLVDLEQGRLLIVLIGGWKPVWAHYLILVSTHPKNGLGFVDPAIPDAEIKWRSLEEFTRLWNNYGRIAIIIDPLDQSINNATGQ